MILEEILFWETFPSLRDFFSILNVQLFLVDEEWYSNS